MKTFHTNIDNAIDKNLELAPILHHEVVIDSTYFSARRRVIHNDLVVTRQQANTVSV
jgi:hypothetical protein